MSDDPKFTYTNKWIGSLLVLMCDTCGALVDNMMQSDHTAMHEGQDVAFPVILWAQRKQMLDMTAREASRNVHAGDTVEWTDLDKTVHRGIVVTEPYETTYEWTVPVREVHNGVVEKAIHMLSPKSLVVVSPAPQKTVTNTERVEHLNDPALWRDNVADFVAWAVQGGAQDSGELQSVVQLAQEYGRTRMGKRKDS